jgi:hypothetical protein
LVGANTVNAPAPLKVETRPAFDRAETSVVKLELLVATPAIVGRVVPPLGDPVEVEPDIGEGEAGDMSSLQPTTVNASTAIAANPANFFMALSFFQFSTVVYPPPLRPWAGPLEPQPPAARRLLLSRN